MVVKRKDYLDFIEPTQEDKYRKYKRRKSVLGDLVRGFISLAVATACLNIALSSLKSSGVLEDTSLSVTGMPGGNNGRGFN